jgi:hypothetical protein
LAAIDFEALRSDLLCIFRGRLGVEGHRAVFHAIVGQAREEGLVKDRLRLKDATHVIGDVAIPTTLALVAQIRDKLLTAAQPFDALRVEGERARIEMIHLCGKDQSDEQRLVDRVTHLREILGWVDGARRTRYRGLAKVLCGHLLAVTVANIKRIVHLLDAPIPALPGA